MAAFSPLCVTRVRTMRPRQHRKREASRAVAGVAALLLALCIGASAGRAQIADAILFNGRIVTLDAQSTIAEAIAIRGERIAAVGSNAEIGSLAGTATLRIDLGGRTVIPGLIDSHMHAIRAGLRFGIEASWIGARTIAEALERISAVAQSGGPGSWGVVAGGWTPRQVAERRAPTQAELIAAAPNNPVYIQLSYSAVLLTPRGLGALGIEDGTGLPPGGTLERDDVGRLTGWIRGGFRVITALY